MPRRVLPEGSRMGDLCCSFILQTQKPRNRFSFRLAIRVRGGSVGSMKYLLPLLLITFSGFGQAVQQWEYFQIKEEYIKRDNSIQYTQVTMYSSPVMIDGKFKTFEVSGIPDYESKERFGRLDVLWYDDTMQGPAPEKVMQEFAKHIKEGQTTQREILARFNARYGTDAKSFGRLGHILWHLGSIGFELVAVSDLNSGSSAGDRKRPGREFFFKRRKQK